MKKYFSLIAAALIAFTGCYDKELAELEKEIEGMKAAEVASLQKQVDGVTASIKDLNTLSSELKQYIESLKKAGEALEGELKAVNAELEKVNASLKEKMDATKKDIASQLEAAKAYLDGQKASVDAALKVLEEKDAEISKQIAELKTYADGKFADKTWVEGTFATIASQNKLFDEVAGVKAMIETLQSNLDKVTKEVTAMLDDKVAAMSSKLDADLSAQVKTLSASISSAFEKARKDITAAYTDAIKKAIETSETSIKAWIGAELSKYYTISEAEAQILAIKALLGNVPGDTNLQAEINQLQKELANAKIEVSSTYSAYIEKAIKEAEGRLETVVDSKISELTENVINPLVKRVTDLEGKIKELAEKISKLDERIKTVSEQVEAINKSVTELQGLQSSLEAYIAKLKEDLEKADKANLAELNKKTNDLSDLSALLQKKIADLTAYVGTLPQGETSVVDWVETSLANLQKQFESYYTVAQINKMIEDLNSNIDKILGDHGKAITDLGKKITDDVSSLETSLKKWVNEQLSAYVTASALESAVAAAKKEVEDLFKAEDSKLSGRIDDLSKAVDDVKKTIEANYKKYIDDAIKNGGYLNETIKKAIEDINGSIESIGGDVKTLQDDVKDLKERMKKAEDSLSDYGKQVSALDSMLTAFIKGYDKSTLAAEIKKITDEIAKCQKGIKANADSLATIYTLVYDSMAKDIETILGMGKDLAKVQQDIIDLKAFLGEQKEGETLATLIKALQDQLDACLKLADLAKLKEDIKKISDLSSKVSQLEKDLAQAQKDMGAISSFINGLDVKGTLDELLKKITDEITQLGKDAKEYKEGIDKSIEEITENIGKLSKQIDSLSNAIVAKSFSSITYVPVNKEGTATFQKVAGKEQYTVSFDFVVTPSNLIDVLVANDGCKMKYIVTPSTRAAEIGYDFGTQVKTKTQEGYLRFTVTVNEIDTYKSGISAAVVVNIAPATGVQPVSFTSKFIPVSVPSSVGKTSFSETEFVFGWEGGTSDVISIEPKNNSWVIKYQPAWVSVTRMKNASFTIKASENAKNQPRSAYVIITHENQDWYLKVSQDARPEQEFVKLEKVTLSVLEQIWDYIFEGYLKLYYKVTTSDGRDDWSVLDSSEWISAYKSGKELRMNLERNPLSDEREGFVRIQSYSGKTIETIKVVVSDFGVE